MKHGQKGIFEELYAELPKLEQFMGAMTGLSRIHFEALAEKFDFSPYQTLCDVGGATGLLSLEVARRQPHLMIVVEALIDDARRENVFGLRMSLKMLIKFGDAFDYWGADFRGWCTEAGFTRCEVIHLAGASSAAVAYKWGVVAEGTGKTQGRLRIRRTVQPGKSSWRKPQRTQRAQRRSVGEAAALVGSLSRR